VLPEPGVTELADAVKFVTNFKPTQLATSLGNTATQLLNTMFIETPSHPPSQQKNHQKNYRTTKNSNSGQLHVGGEWKSSGLVVDELVHLVSMSRDSGNKISS